VELTDSTRWRARIRPDIALIPERAAFEGRSLADFMTIPTMSFYNSTKNATAPANIINRGELTRLKIIYISFKFDLLNPAQQPTPPPSKPLHKHGYKPLNYHDLLTKEESAPKVHQLQTTNQHAPSRSIIPAAARS
jgi:hypothetical protein